MASRSRVLTIALVLAALGGCKKDKDQPAPAGGSAATAAADLGPMDPLVAEVHAGLAKHRDELCRCQDLKCADNVQVQLGNWLMTYQARAAEIDQKSTPAQIEAAKKITAEHDACGRKLAGR